MYASKKLVPEIFKNKRHIDEIKGVMYLSGSLMHRLMQISVTEAREQEYGPIESTL